MTVPGKGDRRRSDNAEGWGRYFNAWRGVATNGFLRLREEMKGGIVGVLCGLKVCSGLSGLFASKPAPTGSDVLHTSQAHR
jgi:hypothetical protein